MSDAVQTQVGSDTVSASAVVDAPPAVVFDFIRRPANHSIISGDSSVKGTTSGPEELSLGDRFGMSMKLGLPYRITNKVVEFEPGRRIAWCHMGGHRWRWEVEDAGNGRSKVTETFDMTASRFPPALRLMGYPRGHEKNVANSVSNVVAHFATGDASGGSAGGASGESPGEGPGGESGGPPGGA